MLLHEFYRFIGGLFGFWTSQWKIILLLTSTYSQTYMFPNASDSFGGQILKVLPSFLHVLDIIYIMVSMKVDRRAKLNNISQTLL
jgi:hypothetical protein